jgi:hypothetical protein
MISHLYTFLPLLISKNKESPFKIKLTRLHVHKNVLYTLLRKPLRMDAAFTESERGILIVFSRITETVFPTLEDPKNVKYSNQYSFSNIFHLF